MKLIILAILLSGCRSESSEPEVVIEMECLAVKGNSFERIERCVTLEAVCYTTWSGGISCIPKYNLNHLDRE